MLTDSITFSSFSTFTINQQTSPQWLTIWSTHCNNIVNNTFDFDNMVNNIATILLTKLSISTVCFTICNNKIIKQYRGNCQYCDNNIVKIDNMVNNIVIILFTIFANLTTLLTILLQYCYFVTILWTILRSVMAKAGDVFLRLCDRRHGDVCKVNIVALTLQSFQAITVQLSFEVALVRRL